MKKITHPCIYVRPSRMYGPVHIKTGPAERANRKPFMRMIHIP